MTSAVNNFNNVGVLNNISLKMPHFSLLSQPEEIDEKMFCDVQSSRSRECIDKSAVCRCVHRLKVELGSIVELILIDVDDSLTHPFHLHGHKFYVMEMSTFKEHLRPFDILKNGIPALGEKLNEHPPHKDTVLIPNPGYIRLKFRADNPGFWLGHCHFDWHLSIGENMELRRELFSYSSFFPGMAVIFQVGELDQMKKPPEGFSKCKSFLPDSLN